MQKNKEYYENLDKRTKEYKEWVLSQEGLEPHKPKTQEELEQKHKENSITGLGDIVEKVTKATGIKKIVEYFTPEGEDCGCDERKKKLNKIPIIRHKKTLCLTLEEYNYMKPLLENNKQIKGEDVKKLLDIYQRVFQVKIITTCNGCSLGKKIDELKAILSTYE